MPDFTPEETAPPPISVKATATPVVVSETFKVLFVAGFGAVADHFFHSETVIIAVMAAAGILSTWAWGLWHRIRSWGALRYLASLAPDHVAVVGSAK